MRSSIIKLLLDLVDALVNNEVDVIYTNSFVSKYIINNELHTIKPVGEKIAMGQGFGIIALNKHAKLIKKINAALLMMEEDGSYLTIYNHYFGYK